jgi:hypothetical protein
MNFTYRHLYCFMRTSCSITTGVLKSHKSVVRGLIRWVLPVRGTFMGLSLEKINTEQHGDRARCFRSKNHLET